LTALQSRDSVKPDQAAGESMSITPGTMQLVRIAALSSYGHGPVAQPEAQALRVIA
jgi:hypothetical protein